MRVPISLPELGAHNEPVRISCWLADLGELVDEGDRLVEVLIHGVTFDVPAPASGMLVRIETSFDADVRTGDTLGWIETNAGES